MNKESGGLGVKRLKEVNYALLGNWCWKSMVDRKGLWFKMLSSRTVLRGGRLRRGVDIGLLGGGRL